MPTGIYVRSETQKRNISAGMMGKQNRLGGHVSDETKAKISATMAGVPKSDETRARMSAAQVVCFTNPERRAMVSVAMKGNTYTLGHHWHHSEASRVRESAAHMGLNWKGGPMAFRRRSKAKRRLLGFVPLNECFVGCEGHHVDNEQVINMPKALHRSIYHNQHTGQGMAQINAIAYNFLFKQEVEEALEARRG